MRRTQEAVLPFIKRDQTYNNLTQDDVETIFMELWGKLYEEDAPDPPTNETGPQ